MAKKEFSISLGVISKGLQIGLKKAESYLKSFHDKVKKGFNYKDSFGGNKLSSAFKSQMKVVESSIDNVSLKMKDFGKTIAGVFAFDKLVDLGKSVVQVGMNFEDQMARVKAISKATTREFEAMEKEAVRLGEATRYSATEAAQALENLLRNGLSAKKATKALAGVLELAGSQAIDLAKAADIATATMNGFGKEVDELGKINDILASTTSNSATNVTELSEALKVAAPIARVLDISMEEICAALGVLANNAIKGSQAGTALRIMLNRLVSVTPKGAEALKKYGLQISEADVRGKNFTDTLEKLSKANMSLADLKAIFGEEASSSSAALLKNFKGYTETKTVVENSGGEAERQFREGQGETKTALNELSSKWDTLLTGIFTNTKKVFLGIVDGIKSIINEIQKLHTIALVTVSGIGIAIGRYYKKINDEFKQKIAGEQNVFNSDLMASVIAKGEFKEDPFLATISAMETRVHDIKGLVGTIESVYDSLSDSDKKAADKSIKLGKDYIDILQRRIAYTKQLANLHKVNEPVKPDMPKHYSELLKGNKVEKFLDGLGDAAGVVAGAAGGVNSANKALGGSKKVDDISNKVAFGASAVSGAAKTGNWITRQYSKWKHWLKHKEPMFGKKKGPTGYYSGEDSKAFEMAYYEQQMKFYNRDLKAYEEYVEKKKSLESELDSERRASIGKMKDAQSISGKDFEQLLSYDVDEGLKEFTENVQKAKEERNELIKTGPWKKLGSAIKNVGSSIFNMLGGWIGITTTALSFAINGIINYFKEQNRVFKEVEEQQKNIISDYATMETKVMSLIGVMKQHDTESTAWKSAMSALSSEYPELLKHMDKEKISIQSTSEEYRRLKERIRDVIAEQREYMLNEHKRTAIDKLQKDYTDKTNKLGNSLTNIFTKGSIYGDNISKEAATILSARLRSDILGMLSGGSSQGDIAKFIESEFKKYNVSLGTNSLGSVSSQLAKSFFGKYQRYDKEIKSINALDSGLGVKNLDQRINELVNYALSDFEAGSKTIKSIGKAKNQSEEEINSAIENLRSELLDKLVNDLEGISSKIEGKTALQYAKDNGLYDILLGKNSSTGKSGSGSTITTTTTTTFDGDTKTPKQLFDETKKFIDALKKSGIIDENEYRERLINAYDTYISSLESEQKTGDKDIETLKTLMSERDKVKKELEKSQKAEEDFNKATEEFTKVREESAQADIDRMFEAEKLSKDLSKTKDNKGRRGSGYIWDKFNFSDKFEKDLINMEFDFQKLDQYLQDLQSIGGDKFDVLDKIEELSKLGQKSGAQELIKQLQILLDELEKAEKAATDLDSAIQLKKAQKEIKEMQSESSKMIYDTVKNGVQGLDSLANSWVSLFENFSDMNFGEQFSGIVNTVFSTIDTVMSFLESLKQVTEFMELLGLKKEALAAIEQTTSGATIAAIQAEAGAVVAAEAEKTAAITGALATQASANLVAKAAQTSAATTAMAAESTAAYASIPFAGVGLAAAQIAEMQALIAATAALPMFAEGGIVGGSKYYGDQNLARVNSGEMILNRTQQSRLWGIVNGGSRNNSSIGKVEFEITGQKLRGVLKNYDNKMGKLS